MPYIHFILSMAANVLHIYVGDIGLWAMVNQSNGSFVEYLRTASIRVWTNVLFYCICSPQKDQPGWKNHLVV